MINRVLIIVLMILGLTSGFCMNDLESNSYLTTIHFSSHAFGKRVVAVYGHLGILMTDDQYESFWLDTKHIDMEYKGDHYFGKAVLNANSGKGYPDIVGPRIQYWVHFEDGSKIITEAYEIPIYAVSMDDTSEEEKFQADFYSRHDTWRTEAVRIVRKK